MRTPLVLALVTAVILGGSLTAPAYAKPGNRERAEQRDAGVHDDRERHKKDSDQRKRSRKGVLSRDEAARRVQRQHGGKVLSVDLLQSEDAPARYRVKLFSHGNVRTIDVDALED